MPNLEVASARVDWIFVCQAFGMFTVHGSLELELGTLACGLKTGCWVRVSLYLFLTTAVQLNASDQNSGSEVLPPLQQKNKKPKSKECQKKGGLHGCFCPFGRVGTTSFKVAISFSVTVSLMGEPCGSNF